MNRSRNLRLPQKTRLAVVMRRNINDRVYKKYGTSWLGEFGKFGPVVVHKQIGEGGFGTVYFASVGRQQMILKFQEQQGAEREFWVQEQFYNKGVSVPKPLYFTQFSHKGRRYAIIASSINKFALEVGMFEDMLKTPLPSDTLEAIYQSLKQVIEQVCSKNLIHGDLHQGNIGWLEVTPDSTDRSILTFQDRGRTKHVKPFLIDFGWSVPNAKCNPDLEFVQFLRVLLFPEFARKNVEYLFPRIFNLWSSYSKLPQRLGLRNVRKPRTPEFNILEKAHREIHNNYERYTYR